MLAILTITIPEVVGAILHQTVVLRGVGGVILLIVGAVVPQGHTNQQLLLI